MDSNSAISPSSPPPPSSQAHSAFTNEDYETASDPVVDLSDLAGVTEKTLLPEENGVAISPVIQHQKTASEDEGEGHDSSYKGFLGENSDFVAGEEKMVEEERNDASLRQNRIEVSGEGEDEMNVGNGCGERQVEEDEKLGGEMENANDFKTIESDDTAMELKAVETSNSGADSAALVNQSAVEGVEREGIEDESAVVASGEVVAENQHGFEEEKSVNPDDVLDHKNVVAAEPKAVEVETEPDEPSVDVGSASESSDDVDELVGEVEAERNSVKQEEIGAINEPNSVKSIGVDNLQDAETPELDSVESSKADSESVVSTEDKLDQVNYSESGNSLNQEVADEKVVVGLEHVSSHGGGEQVNADEGASNSAAEEETLPVSAKEIVAVDENVQGTATESPPQKNTTDTLDHLKSSEINERRASMNQEIIDEDEKKVVVGSDNASVPDEGEDLLKFDAGGGDLNAADELATLPDTTKEIVIGDKNISETTTENQPQNSELDQQVEPDADESQVGEAEDEKDEEDEDEDEDDEGRISDGPARVAILDSPEAAKQIIREMERISSSSRSGLQGSRDYSSNADGQIVSDPDEALDSDEDGDGGELFDSAALAALLKAATGSSDGTVTVTSQDAARIFSVDRPAGLGTAPSLRPAVPRSTRPSLFNSTELAAVSDASHAMDDDEKTLREKVEQIRVKFLRLVHRLGHSPDDTVAAQVLYRLSLAEGIRQGRQVSRAFSTEGARKQALKLEEEGKDDLDFSCNILVLGKTGVGKSATINSIFGEERSRTNPFEQATTSVREISGVVNGVRIRVIDTPGLKSSIMDQATNRRILSSIKKFMKKCPPDIVLYVDRMDTQTRDFNDLPLLRSINSILGSSIWFNAIVALTHAASAPPDGPNGSPLGYEIFIDQRSHVIQLSIRQAAADMRLMNPVALVENHPSCRRNREGERVLPNGLSWRPQLLLLCFSSKILSEANSLLKLQDSSPGKLFGFRLRSPPLPFLLSSLLQSRAHPKLSGDRGGDNADSDIDLDDLSDAEQDEEEDEYDQLPPFKPLRKVQIAKLTKEQRKAYFDEYDYRVKLLQKKQWKEELRQLKEVKKRGKANADEFPNGDMPEDYDQDGSPAAVQVPLPDMVLPPSFDCNNPAYRYRFLEPTSQLLSRPVLDTHGWDHDCGYDGVSIEENLAIVGRFPTSMAVQITKDKKEFNIHLDSSIAAKHGEHGSTLAGFDIQSVGKQLAYILRGETKFKNLKKNKTAAGISVTFLGETVATGLKVEDRISISKRLGFVASTGAVRAQGDVAFGANLEARLKDKDYPFGQALSTLGLSLMKWRNDLALGANLQSQFSVGRNSKMAVRVGLNNKLTGQISVRTSSSEQLQIALAGIVPLAISIYRTIASNESYLDH